MPWRPGLWPGCPRNCSRASRAGPANHPNGANKELIQYHPAWNQTITNVAQQGVSGILPPIKTDTLLGGDVTGADPNVGGPFGALWKRHDGLATIDQSLGVGSVQDTLRFTLNTQNTESGFSTSGSATDVNRTVQATLTFTNWFVRWLGIYLLFLDNSGKPVDPSGVEIQLPADYDAPSDDREKLNNFAAMFGLLLGPEFTVLGIPVAASTATMGFNIPPGATTVRVFASGPSLRVLGGVDPDDPETWGDWFPGMLCTLLLNYALPMLLMVAGATSFLSAVQKLALPVAAGIVNGLTTLISDELRNQDFSKPDVWQTVALAVMKGFLGSLVNKRSAQLARLSGFAPVRSRARRVTHWLA